MAVSLVGEYTVAAGFNGGGKSPPADMSPGKHLSKEGSPAHDPLLLAINIAHDNAKHTVPCDIHGVVDVNHHH